MKKVIVITILAVITCLAIVQNASAEDFYLNKDAKIEIIKSILSDIRIKELRIKKDLKQATSELTELEGLSKKLIAFMNTLEGAESNPKIEEAKLMLKVALLAQKRHKVFLEEYLKELKKLKEKYKKTLNDLQHRAQI